MASIPYTLRIDGRYSFRRRIHFRNIISKPITIALKTADPAAARLRAAVLAARFAVVKAQVSRIVYERALTGSQIEALFRHKLQKELRFYLTSAYEDEAWSCSVLGVAREEGEAYRFLSRPDSRHGITDEYREQIMASDFDGLLDSVEQYVGDIRTTLSDEMIARALRAVGASEDDYNISAARKHMIRAGASACTRVQRLFDADVLDAADPLRAITADLGEPSAEVAALLRKLSSETAPVPSGDAQPAATGERSHGHPECQFAIYDNRRFSVIIEEVIAELKADKVWKGDLTQQRRILRTFAWITGDLELGSYDHRHVSAFKTGLQRLPTSFRFGTPERGAMSRPFAEVVAELPPLTPPERRNLKTINRDLSTMSTVAKRLALTAWKPKVPGAVVLDFAAATVAIQEEDSTELRPPWTTAHLEILFASPLYHGGGGARCRLKTDGIGQAVYHDAAYFAPLLWYYTHACREEICGLEVDDVVLDHAVPHIIIRDNLTRGRDGEKAGEKRLARRRKLPIHPELKRLGFFEYVAAVASEGHCALFPELYLFESKRGGAQFYDRAWQHMVHWIGDRLPLPRNSAGKGPDIHSIRALGSSFYEVDGANENIRADIMGHARQGTNGKHYSKRLQTEGLTVVLGERLEFISRYVPIITQHLKPAPIRLLPIDKRSRIGTGRPRKVRSDRGLART